VTIKTKTKTHNGFLGKVEGWMTTHLLRPIYIKELQQLAIVASSKSFLFP
jgi:hypothetical protein